MELAHIFAGVALDVRRALCEVQVRALMEHVSLNLAGTFLLDPVL